MAHYLSTAQTAEALGLGVSTIKRWVDEGILPAHRTAGGHRKILRDDLVRLIHEGRIPCTSVQNIPGMQELPNLDQLREQLLRALRGGNSEEVFRLIHGSFDNGMSIASLADELISPVMSALGHDWQTGQIDVFEEHRGTWLCVSALAELKQRLRPSRSPKGLALGGGPEGDPYLLSNLLIEMSLVSMGWRVVNLGPNVPMSSFEKALKRIRPNLLWVSVSHLPDPERFLAEYENLYRVADKLGASVAIGGQALLPEIRSRMMYTTFGDGLRHLTAFIQAGHQDPSESPT